jgi:membrane protein implicated in regulation of membrane protease activity
MLRTRRDVLFILISILAVGLVNFFVYFVEQLIGTDWNLPIWLIILAIVLYLIIFAMLLFVMWRLFKRIEAIEKREDDENKLDRAKLDAIVNQLGITTRKINKQKIVNDRVEKAEFK